MSSLKKLAIRGAIWTIFSYGASQVLRFGSNLILTRLLFPKLFGLMALVTIFLMGLQLFSDVGIGPSIIQNKRGDDPDFLNTAWTLQVVRGFGLWLFCLLLAWPAANFYNEPQLLWLVPIVGITTIISGFNSTALFTLNRHIALGKLAIFDLATQVISLLVMIIWAKLNPTIWALVVGNIFGTFLKMVASHFLIPDHLNKLAWDHKAAKELFSFGRWIFVSTAVTFIGTQADKLILGKLVSFELLGVYNIALTLALLPGSIISALSTKVIFPVAAKLADLPREEFRQKILQNRWPVLLLTVLMLTVLVSFGDVLILHLYDRRYAQAAWMLPILSLGVWPNILSETVRQSLLAIGKPSYQAYAQFFKSLFMCIGLPLGFFLNGLVGAVVVVALNDLPFYAVISYGLWRERLNFIKQDFQATSILLLLIALILVGRFTLGSSYPSLRTLASY